jgi:hypothetical protein
MLVSDIFLFQLFRNKRQRHRLHHRGSEEAEERQKHEGRWSVGGSYIK